MTLWITAGVAVFIAAVLFIGGAALLNRPRDRKGYSRIAGISALIFGFYFLTIASQTAIDAQTECSMLLNETHTHNMTHPPGGAYYPDVVHYHYGEFCRTDTSQSDTIIWKILMFIWRILAYGLLFYLLYWGYKTVKESGDLTK